jgi:pyruvate kinase
MGLSALPVIGGILDNIFASNRQEDAQSFSAQQYATRYQTQVEDMKKAGINPMLSATSGAGSQPSGAVATPGSNMSNAGLQMAQIQNIKAQTELNSAQAAKARVEAEVASSFAHPQAEANLNQTFAQTGLTAAQSAKAKEETTNIVATLANIQDENLKIRRAAELLYQQSNLASQQQMTEAQRYNLVKAQTQHVIAQAGLANLDIDAAESLNNIGRTSQQLKPIIDMMRAIIRK